MITYHDHAQGSDSWFAARCGRLTASNFATAMGKGVTRQKLLHRLRAERRSGYVEPSFTSGAMQDGIEREPQARAYAAFELGLDIKEVGLATNDAYPGLGASLDGLIGDNVGYEAKSPKQATHDEYLWRKRLPPVYKWQVHGQMLVCGLESVWFMSFHPNDTEQLLINIPRDEKILDELMVGLARFLDELHDMECKA